MSSSSSSSSSSLRRSACTLFLAAIVAVPAGAATVPYALDAKLASLILETNTPGAAASITRRGKLVWSGAAGLANPSDGTPFTTKTLSSVASVTKLFTSTIVKKLSEDNLVDLDAPIARYLPQAIPGADRVTVRQLVEMTAGYADVELLPKNAEASKDPNHVWSREALFADIEAPQFDPGTQFEYSNTNYLLLGQIIDTTYPGGTSAAFRDYIAGPAGLGNDVVFDRDPAVASRVADGFSTLNGVTVDVNEGANDLGVNTSVWGTLWTDGGIVATADGLARFSDALYGGRLLNAPNTAIENNGGSILGGGLESGNRECNFTYADRCWSGFVGAFNGYSAFILHDPDRDVSITAVLSGLNDDTGAQIAFLPGLVETYIAEVEVSPVPLPAGLPLLAAGLIGLGLIRRRQNRRADKYAASDRTPRS